MRQGKTPRAPSMRVLVRWALKCENAEQLGRKLKQRYDRQRGHTGSPGQADMAEVEKLLADP
jgi:hypothetical protein